MTTLITNDTAHCPDYAARSTPKNRCPLPLLLSPLLLAAALGFSHDARAVGKTSRVSVDAAGHQGNREAYDAVISADGRFVAFESPATNLVPGDTNGSSDVFVHDRRTHQTSRVSVDSAGHQGNSYSYYPSLSADGRYVAFWSASRNLVPGDTNEFSDVFVHDRLTHETTRVSVDSAGHQGNRYSDNPEISANGRFVAFRSDASNLVPGFNDEDFRPDVFVHDRHTHRTTLVSVDSAGNRGNRLSSGGVLSANGRFVAFLSGADNLVPGDTNGVNDIFVHDRLTHETTRVSVDSAGNQGNGESSFFAISGDGRYVAFTSLASNLVPGDSYWTRDVFVHDRQTHETTRVSVDSAGGTPLNAWAYAPAISADGRFVAFSSDATNLSPGDTNDSTDVFVHDRQTHETTRASLDSAANEGNAGSFTRRTGMSADGRFVAFESAATNLVPGDTNGRSDIFIRDRLLDRSVTADLGITQTADPAQFVPLSPLTYTLTAVNHGPDAATDVTVKDSPALLSGTVLSVTPSQGSCSQGAPFVCYLGTLAPGASSTITVSLQPLWRGTLSLWNTAQVNAAPVDGKLTNNQSTLRTDVAQ